MGKFMFGGLNIITGAAWLPLVLFGLRKFTITRLHSWLLLASAAMGLCILDGTPQIDLYTYLFSALFLLASWMSGRIKIWQLVTGSFLFVTVSLSLGLCQIAPTGEFALLSNRWHWSTHDLMRDALVPENLQFFINPFFMGEPMVNYHGTGGYAEVQSYIGRLPLLLALGGVIWFRKRPMAIWLGMTAVLSVILAMANTTPFTDKIYLLVAKYIPGFSHNRIPSRIMLLATFALASLAGLGLQAWSIYWRGKNFQNHFSRFFFLAAVPLMILAGTAFDLYKFDLKHIEGASDSRPFFTDLFPQDVLDMIKKDPNYPRVQPNSDYCEYQLLQKVSSVYTGCGSFFISATEKYVNEQYAHPDTPLSDLIRLDYNYRKVGSPPTDRWQKISGIDFSCWHDTKAFPRAFMVGRYRVDPDENQVIEDIRDGKFDPHQELVLGSEPSLKPEGSVGWMGGAKITRYDFNDVEIRCQNDKPCFLFLSDSYYPGWKAWVDGEEEPIYRADGAFRAVPLLQPGTHRVTFSFYPPVIVMSFYYSAACWALLFVGWLVSVVLRVTHSTFIQANRATKPRLFESESKSPEVIPADQPMSINPKKRRKTIGQKKSKSRNRY
ncbi:MAG TPA: YfhO family protein [bacterium]|nr:YfhO family protein [bacterium]